MNKPVITKNQLVDILQSWQQGKITAQQLQDWMVLNYDPDDALVGVGESVWTIEAMNIVMNEYEIARVAKFIAGKADLAIKFIAASETDFESAKTQFIRRAFAD